MLFIPDEVVCLDNAMKKQRCYEKVFSSVMDIPPGYTTREHFYEFFVTPAKNCERC